ncbi:Protein CBG07583 [Caenorhabditis briggsae]|uniref:Protein CBG07583 n=1 Tax=Caenorhabditis briggsae TaxID=6238 RepID=A8X4I3_CAEBR|nr:Protein CBG07583 [Caenorhabditis briggsae]CAP27543.2 Protein CBG07583 [Caenorhabditis briggsae]
MITNETSPAGVNLNSLQMDKQMTQRARDIARRIQLRVGEIQTKADDMEAIVREVTLRVGYAASKMGNLKNQKPVQQVVSTQNIKKEEDSPPNRISEDAWTPLFLETYKKAILEPGQTIIPMVNHAVFRSGSFGDSNGYTNGHSIANGHTRSMDGSERSIIEESENEEPEEPPRAQIPKPPVIPVNLPIRRDASPSLPPTPTPIATKVGIMQQPTIIPRQEPEPQVEPHTPQDTSGVTRESLPAEEINSTQKIQARPAALASVISEMRAKVATRQKFFDSDSDSDTEPLRISQPKPSTSTTLPKDVAIDPSPVPRRSEPSISRITPVERISKTEVPPALQRLTAKSSTAKNTTQGQGNECKLVANIFDSDSESDTEFSKPPPKPTMKAVAKNSSVVSTSKQNEKKEAVKSTLSEREISNPLFEGEQSVKIASVPLKVETKPVEKIVEIQKPVANVETKKSETVETKTAPPVAKVEAKQAPPPVAKVGRSIFSDSDSDDDFLKSFSKPKTPAATTAAKETPAAAAAEPKVVRNRMRRHFPLLPWCVFHTFNISVLMSILVLICKFSGQSHHTTRIDAYCWKSGDKCRENKGSNKRGTKKPAKIFSIRRHKPKMLNTPNNTKPKVNTPVTTGPLKSAPSSEQTLPETATGAKKEQTSKAMSAKISLIADLQKKIRLPGAPPPAMPSKDASNEKKDTLAAENGNGTTTILKSRCRGPPNRRPPTRPTNVSN